MITEIDIAHFDWNMSFVEVETIRSQLLKSCNLLFCKFMFGHNREFFNKGRAFI